MVVLVSTDVEDGKSVLGSDSVSELVSFFESSEDSVTLLADTRDIKATRKKELDMPT